MSVNYKEFGKNKDNNNIVLITLTNENGYAMGVTNLGASLVSFCAKDKNLRNIRYNLHKIFSHTISIQEMCLKRH